MKPRSLAALGMLLLCSATWAQGPTPSSRPAPATTAPHAAAPPEMGRRGTADTARFLPDSAILGHVDGRVFRVREFVDRWFAAYLLDRPQPDSAGRAEFLNSMANKEVLAAVARQVNRPLTFEDRVPLRETQQRLLSNATFARLISDSVHCTPEEVQHLYQQSQYRLHLQRIVTADPTSAERARTDVVAKRLAWPEAVRRYSRTPGTDDDLGWVRRDSLGPAAALEIFDLPDGGVSSVFHSGDGWWFVHVLGRRPDPHPYLQELGKLFAQEVLSVKLARRTEQVREQVRRHIGLSYDSTNIAWAASLFAETEAQTPAPSGTREVVIDLSGAIPDFQPADTSRVLARWRDGSFSLGAFLDRYNATPVPGRDKIGTFGDFRSTLDRFVLEPYMAELAIQRGLEHDPIVTDGMAKKEEQLRVEHLFRDSIEARLWVSSEERRQYYEQHLPDFFGLQSVTYAAFVTPSKTGADSLAARLRAGERAADILRADSLAGTVRGSIKREGERDTGEYHGLVFNEMREGDVHILGPDRKGECLVLQKLIHDPGHQLSLEEVMSVVDESVQNLKAERMLREFIARHRAGHDIELHPELVMRIRLVDSHE
jgi:hypothetical protein